MHKEELRIYIKASTPNVPIQTTLEIKAKKQGIKIGLELRKEYLTYKYNLES